MNPNSLKINIVLLLMLIGFYAHAQRPQTPLMGWSSWNNYRVNISEDIIKKQADAMVDQGLLEAGYTYLNMDDGYFGGRDGKGNLYSHPEKFPSGMKDLADYIHSKGLKAGIYTDAGINTCASYWDKDTLGVGVGLYGHESRDLSLMIEDWGYDFVKVDWCGGDWMGLTEEVRYTEISKIIREMDPSVVFNVCRWEFPGEWVVNIADSWRVSPDIGNNFKSIMRIIDQNADLWMYSGPGHVNDMDILQVGRGMTFEEDKTHFTMWCMLNSPLIASNDLTTISEETLSILTNKELIAINQDPMVYQARRVIDHGDLEVWAKPLISTISGQVAVTLLNRTSSKENISFNLKDVGLSGENGYSMTELWSGKYFEKSKTEKVTFEVPSHGVVVLKIEGESLPFNLFQYKPKNKDN
ncbi:glycoside hydrolase family 27 protein [Echinicola marina]|uniref:glycoside hydrolase family 27 protein n=1 Tax=Echinicola marina TaxID=2859768 RepID=UPI001CF6448C|nr:glycoside hydrolase family 27 protein [Echinicola marina]UCS93373.1 glycoside hydrolase family 27 protein [Echinicola marina]